MPVSQTSPLSPPESTTERFSQPQPRTDNPCRRSWRAKIGVALRGIKWGIRGHSSFAVHFFFTALVLAAAIVFRCTLIEWCLLLGCIGLVLTAELFNSALETLFRCLDEPLRNRAWPCLDIAAGAVLLASITAAVIGSLIFLAKVVNLLNFATMGSGSP